MPATKDTELGVKAGDVLAGKYTVERVLGTGGMGFVVAAYHADLDTRVAIKMLHPEGVESREAVDRFAREGRALAKLTTEHVARVLDVGRLESGAPFMVMEYLQGEDLDQWLESKGRLDLEQAVEFIVHACVALAEAHGLGIVHRDLKPANLFCTRRPDGQFIVKVLDFGISKMTALEGAPSRPQVITQNLTVMGSPFYMSPEQMKSTHRADAQSDVWALGVSLYELLSAELPFVGESETDIAISVSALPPRSLRAFRPEISEALEAVVLKCLTKDRGVRYQNVAELASALAPFAPSRAQSSIERIAGTIETARLARSGSNPALVSAPIEVSTVSWPRESRNDAPGAITLLGQTKAEVEPPKEVTPRRRAWRAAAVAALLGVGVAAFFRVRTGEPSSVESATVAAAKVESTGVSSIRTSMGSAAADVTVADLATLAPPAPASAPSATASPTISASAMTSRSAPSALPRRASPPPVGRPAAQTLPAAVVSCDPPFTLDQQGRKHFKRECF